MNCGIQAGLITLKNFDVYAQKLITLCGSDFNDCGTRTLASLKNRLLRGHDVYNIKTKTLIKKLGLTTEEQKEMKTINALRRDRRHRMPRRKWLALHHTENDQPWNMLHVSRSTYYARRKRRKEAIRKKRELNSLAKQHTREYLSPYPHDELNRVNLPLWTGMTLYYERERKKVRTEGEVEIGENCIFLKKMEDAC